MVEANKEADVVNSTDGEEADTMTDEPSGDDEVMKESDEVIEEADKEVDVVNSTDGEEADTVTDESSGDDEVMKEQDAEVEEGSGSDSTTDATDRTLQPTDAAKNPMNRLGNVGI